VDVSVADIVLCEFYFSDLKEIKKRPVLAIKDDLPTNDFMDKTKRCIKIQMKQIAYLAAMFYLHHLLNTVYRPHLV